LMRCAASAGSYGLGAFLVIRPAPSKQYVAALAGPTAANVTDDELQTAEIASQFSCIGGAGERKCKKALRRWGWSVRGCVLPGIDRPLPRSLRYDYVAARVAPSGSI